MLLPNGSQRPTLLHSTAINSTHRHLAPDKLISYSILSDREVEWVQVHDLLGTRCDPYVFKMYTGKM